MVSEAIANLTTDPDRTVIVIAHRPATLATADAVVALDAGRVVEQGTPVQLRETGGMFARVYAQYETTKNGSSSSLGASMTRAFRFHSASQVLLPCSTESQSPRLCSYAVSMWV
ncbi:hypothetical protein [Amycolatopsis sp. cmx-11-51]|uniref:hypothetical protein n=1 Tax=unclassified Amycolatopsis TaxID=2618356 RepID=UPI0039E6EE2C